MRGDRDRVAAPGWFRAPGWTRAAADQKGPAGLGRLARNTEKGDFMSLPDSARLTYEGIRHRAAALAAAAALAVAGLVTLALPAYAAPAPAGAVAYVANAISDTVSVVSTATNTITATIPVGGGPDAVAVTPDGTEVLTR